MIEDIDKVDEQERSTQEPVEPKELTFKGT